jgi:hypothetical protein
MQRLCLRDHVLTEKTTLKGKVTHQQHCDVAICLLHFICHIRSAMFKTFVRASDPVCVFLYNFICTHTLSLLHDRRWLEHRKQEWREIRKRRKEANKRAKSQALSALSSFPDQSRSMAGMADIVASAARSMLYSQWQVEKRAFFCLFV